MLQVRVHPGAKQDAVGGLYGGALKISLKAPPVEGRANAALIEFLATRLGVPRSRVSLAAGAGSRTKTLRIEGRSAAELRSALLAAVDA